MNEIREISNQVKLYGSIISAPSSLLHVFDSPQGDGTPYIKIEKDLYKYIIEERGMTFEARATDQCETLLYWLMRDVISAMASAFELSNRLPNADSRRLSFLHQIDLMRMIKTEWAEMRAEEMNKILKQTPYVDEI